MFKKLSKTLLVSILAFSLLSTNVYATDEKHPMEHGSKSEATVSEEVDRATNTDDDMATSFYVYIPRDSHKDTPLMGDIGIDLNILLLITIGVGAAYLCINKYANKEDK